MAQRTLSVKRNMPEEKREAEKPAGRLPHIGMRKLKSVLAVFAAFWVWQAVRLFFPELEVHPIFMYMYGVIEIRDSSEKTVDMGKLRIKATFTALGTGLPLLALAALVRPYFPAGWMHIAVDLVMILLGVLVTIVIAEKVGCRTFCGLAAAIFIVLLVSHSNDDPYIYAILRAFQTIAGVFIAWLINVQLWPYPKKKKEAS